MLYLDWLKWMGQVTPDVAEEDDRRDAVAIETGEAVDASHHWNDAALSLWLIGK